MKRVKLAVVRAKPDHGRVGSFVVSTALGGGLRKEEKRDWRAKHGRAEAAGATSKGWWTRWAAMKATRRSGGQAGWLGLMALGEQGGVNLGGGRWSMVVELTDGSCCTVGRLGTVVGIVGCCVIVGEAVVVVASFARDSRE